MCQHDTLNFSESLRRDYDSQVYINVFKNFSGKSKTEWTSKWCGCITPTAIRTCAITTTGRPKNRFCIHVYSSTTFCIPIIAHKISTNVLTIHMYPYMFTYNIHVYPLSVHVSIRTYPRSSHIFLYIYKCNVHNIHIYPYIFKSNIHIIHVYPYISTYVNFYCL